MLNAGAASSRGSSVKIKVERRQLEEEFRGYPDDIAPGHHLCLTVEDDGVGMDKEVLASAFDPFFTTKTSERGSGLGLGVVLGTVHQSGGKVHITSSPGKGTRVSLWFPVTDLLPTWSPMGYQVISPASTPSDLLEDVRVVYVDDDDFLRRAISQVLRNQGATVEDFSNGQEAIESMLGNLQGFPDVLLSDVIMPGLSGPDLSQLVREHGYDGPTVFLSGYISSSELRAHLDEADLALKKPIAAEKLVINLHRCLDHDGGRTVPGVLR